jgi:NAD(P) transhydrogenase subunit alpha
MGGSENYRVNLEDEVIRGATVVHEGEVIWPAPKVSNPSPQPVSPTPVATTVPEKVEKKNNSWLVPLLLIVPLVLLGKFAPSEFLTHLTIFVLACFVGWQIIWNVTPALHTPLMSVTNAISGIIIIGGMLQVLGTSSSPIPIALGAIAVFIGTINISGGFLVTQRMLKMFQRD